MEQRGRRRHRLEATHLHPWQAEQLAQLLRSEGRLHRAAAPHQVHLAHSAAPAVCVTLAKKSRRVEWWRLESRSAAAPIPTHSYTHSTHAP